MGIYLEYDRTHLFGRMQGDGSKSAIDELIDSNAIIENDGRSTTRTMFYAEDATYENRATKKKMKWLAKLNDGMYENGRFTANYNADVRRFAQTIGGQLEMTPHQKARTEYVLGTLDMNSFGPYNAEKITMAVISLVCNEDRRLVRDEPEFRAFLDDIYMTLDELKRVRRMVLERTEAFNRA